MNTYVLTICSPDGDIKIAIKSLYDAIHFISGAQHDFYVELNNDRVYEFIQNPTCIPSDIWD